MSQVRDKFSNWFELEPSSWKNVMESLLQSLNKSQLRAAFLVGIHCKGLVSSLRIAFARCFFALRQPKRNIVSDSLRHILLLHLLRLRLWRLLFGLLLRLLLLVCFHLLQSFLLGCITFFNGFEASKLLPFFRSKHCSGLSGQSTAINQI